MDRNISESDPLVKAANNSSTFIFQTLQYMHDVFQLISTLIIISQINTIDHIILFITLVPCVRNL